MKNKLLFLFSSMGQLGMFFSCSYSCSCDKTFKCLTLTAIQLANDSTLAKQTFCSDSTYSIDSTYRQSERKFFLQYYKEDLVKILWKDSIVGQEKVNVKGGKERSYIDRGYSCNCDK